MDYFSPVGATTELINFITKNTFISRCDLNNKNYHKKNPDAEKLLFGFNFSEETISFIKVFFTEINVMHPILQYENKSIKMKPSFLTEVEQKLVAQMFMQSFNNRTKFLLVINPSR